jgi:uncharacterized oxidoreductase
MLIHHDNLAEVVRRICINAGTEPSDAQQVASLLVDANLKGHDSHGVQMLPVYIRNISQGHLKPRQHAELVSRTGNNLIVDGLAGYGQIVGPEAIELGMEVAEECGVAVVALRNAHHLGRIGGMGEQCAARGFVSMHYVNVVGHPPVVAPFWGKEPRMVTNPFCCAIPVSDGDPIVLDMATSTIAFGKVRVAYNRGEQVPEGSLIDHQGNETTDPDTMFEAPMGALSHFGRHKGYGLAMVCEILGGALAGGWTIQPQRPRSGTVVNNMLTVILNPDVFGEKAIFQSEVRAMIAYLKSTPPVAGIDEVLIPGEPERIAQEQRRAEGIYIDDTTWSQILATADSVELSSSQIDEIAK